MNYPFEKKTSHTLTRVISVAAAVVLFATMFTGCFKKEENQPTESNPLPTPNLVESTSPTTTEAPTTEAPTTEASKTNVAIVKEQVTVRSLPSMEGNPISQLNAGDEVEINRIESVGAVQWAYIPLKGWVTTDHLDMSNVTISSGSTSTPGATNPSTATTASSATTAATTSGNGGNTGTGTTTGTGKYGVVTASELNIRESANTTSNIAGKYTYGTRVTILETSNGWGRTDKGWVSMQYVYMNGATGSKTAKGIVVGTTLNVRTGPGTNYESVTSYGQLTRVNILEQIKVGNTTWGCTKDGWISLDYVYIDGTTGDGAGTGTVTGDNVNIRSGPGTKYDAVGSVSSGDEIEIYAQFTINNMTWGCTDKGWICMDYVGIG